MSQQQGMEQQHSMNQQLGQWIELPKITDPRGNLTVAEQQKNIPFNIIKKPIRIEQRQSTEKYNIANKYILKIIEHLEKNFASDLSIDELTQMVPLGRRSLEKKFKEAMGTSIYQFIIDKKIEFFSYKLLTTQESSLDIAIEAGFNDVRNAYRIFKKNTGHSPSGFRKKFSTRDKPPLSPTD